MIAQFQGATETPIGSYTIEFGGISIIENAKIRQNVSVETQTSLGITIDSYPGLLGIFYDASPLQ